MDDLRPEDALRESVDAVHQGISVVLSALDLATAEARAATEAADRARVAAVRAQDAAEGVRRRLWMVWFSGFSAGVTILLTLVLLARLLMDLAGG